MTKKNKTILSMLMLTVLAFSSACGSTQPQKAPAASADAAQNSGEPNLAQARGGVSVEAANQQLAGVAVLGFPAFTESMPVGQFDKYGATAANVVKTIVNEMPAGYVLQITGHANQHASKDAQYTKTLSVSRARYVYNYFLKKGIAKTYLSYQGVGADEPDSSLSHDNNRRVTFKLVAK